MTRTCAKCGAELGDMTFCPSCGTRAEAVQVPSAPAGPLPLRAAVVESLRMGGQNLLDDPRRFASYVLDLADKSLPEVRLLSLHADPQLTLPFAEAVRKGDSAAFRTARAKVFDFLRNEQFVDEGLANKLSSELAAGVADHLGVEFDVPEKKQPASASAPAKQQSRPSATPANKKSVASASGASRPSQPSARPAPSTDASALAWPQPQYQPQPQPQLRYQSQPQPQLQPQYRPQPQPQPQPQYQLQPRNQLQPQSQPQPAKKSRKGCIVAVILLIAFAAVGCIIGLQAIMDRPITVYKGDYESSVTVVSSNTSCSDDAMTAELTLENEGNEDIDSISCRFVFIDDDGNVVSESTESMRIYAGSVNHRSAEGPLEAEAVEVYLE